MNTRLFIALAAFAIDLRDEVETTFQVPQCGPHHKEGGFLITHLELVLGALEDMQRGEFHAAVPEHLRPELQRVASAYADFATIYVLTHDLDKGTCMTLKFADGHDEAVTWIRWQEMVSEHPRAAEIRDRNSYALEEMLAHNGIQQISYFQKTSEGVRMHGKVAAERLRARGDIPEIICKAIDTHEIAYQFAGKGGVNIPLFRKVFAGMSDDELAFALLVNLADEMGSWGESGPDITPFVLLAETATAARKLNELESRLRDTAKLDAKKVEAALAKILKATDAFRAETVDAAYKRIVAECAIPSYDEVKLREALGPLVDNGTVVAELLEPLVAGLVAYGAIPTEVGKRLGKANQAVRTAIAGAVV